MSNGVWELLKSADPAQGVPIGTGDAEEVLRRAGNDITSYDRVVPTHHRRAPRLVAAGLVFAAVVVGTTAVALLRPDAGPPRMPPPSIAPGTSSAPASCLTALADSLAATPYDGKTGRYEYIRLGGTSGDTTQVPDRPNSFARATWTEESALWLAADGSGQRRVQRGTPTFQDEESRKFYRDHPGMLPPSGVETTVLAAGEFSVTALPPADPAAMAEALYQPRENGPSRALGGVEDLNRGRVLDAAHRAAVLRFLAATEGVTCGGATDAGGVAGLLVTAQVGKGPHPTAGDLGRRALIFDTRTGELLAEGFADTATAPLAWTTVFLQRGYADVLG